MLRVLDLFAGIGGFSLGLERTGGFRTVAFCEIDPFCRAILRRHWPDVPIHEDVRTLKGDEFDRIDIITGGYPCQPFSVAGQRRGTADDRDLWPEFARLVRTIRPHWVLAENVASHVSLGIDRTLSDLEGESYTCWTAIIPACAVGADHRRDRVWIVAHADAERRQELDAVAIAQEAEQRQSVLRTGEDGILRLRDEPAVLRNVHDVPDRVDRIGALGNAVVPAIPEIIGRAILAAEKEETR